MERSQVIQTPLPAKRKMQIVRMKVDHVELCQVFSKLFKHHHVMSQRIPAIRTGAEGCRTSWYQPRTRTGIAAGKESDRMSQANQFLGQPGDHALGSAVSSRRNTFVEGRNLGNIHEVQRINRTFSIIGKWGASEHRGDAVASCRRCVFANSYLSSLWYLDNQVESVEGAGSRAPAIGSLHARLAREDADDSRVARTRLGENLTSARALRNRAA